MQRYVLFFTAAATAAFVAAPAHAQATTGGGFRTRCTACATTLKDSSRVRRERLLLKFDSLRFEFEHQRVSDAERERIADEMHRTFMALQESLDGVTVRSRAFVTAREGAERMREGIRTSPEIAIAVQSGFRRGTNGYLGVSFDGPGTDEIRQGERIIRFLDYPRIELVEPGSPAERAGIQEGDTLLALNGSDVREREISLTKLLVPDRRIVVRIRRDANVKDLRVTVEKAPGYVMSRMAPMPRMAPMSPMAVGVYPGEMLPRRPMPPGAAIAGTPPEMAQSVWIINEAIGGAKLESINEGLGKALGTKGGVLVLRAAPGTPAYESGLRDGDVILKAAGRAVSSVRELRSVLVDGDREEGVKVGILRERKQREVTLRW